MILYTDNKTALNSRLINWANWKLLDKLELGKCDYTLAKSRYDSLATQIQALIKMLIPSLKAQLHDGVSIPMRKPKRDAKLQKLGCDRTRQTLWIRPLVWQEKNQSASSSPQAFWHRVKKKLTSSNKQYDTFLQALRHLLEILRRFGTMIATLQRSASAWHLTNQSRTS